MGPYIGTSEAVRAPWAAHFRLGGEETKGPYMRATQGGAFRAVSVSQVLYSALKQEYIAGRIDARKLPSVLRRL